MKCCTTEGVRNLDQQSLGSLDNGNTWNFLCCETLNICSKREDARPAINVPERKKFHVTPLSNLPDDFWFQFWTSSIKQFYNKMLSVALMCCSLCSFSLVLFTIDRSYDTFNPVLLFYFKSSLRPYTSCRFVGLVGTTLYTLKCPVYYYFITLYAKNDHHIVHIFYKSASKFKHILSIKILVKRL